MQRSRRSLVGVPWPDAVIAAVLVVAAVVTTALDAGVAHPLTEVISALTAVSVALRTRAPLAMAVWAAAGCMLLAQLPGASTPLWSFVAVLVLAFSAANRLRGVRAGIALLVILAGTVVMQVRTSSSTLEMLVTPVVIVGAPALAGALLARSRAQAERLRLLSAELEREREQHAALAAAAERARITRDLHDILAHTLSSIAVQAGAAQQQLDETSPARASVEQVMASAQEGLSEVRALLAATRDGRPGSTHPHPGIDQLPALTAADGARLVVTGSVIPLPAGLSLAAFRIVQEALTNARKHAAGASVSVSVDYRADALQLTIENPLGSAAALPSATGLGLHGMAERAAAHGGSVVAGPSEGRWLVRAELPYATASGEPGGFAASSERSDASTIEAAR
ncbi:histidine kinase [Microbacterium sp. STN6]|uniref:sensor histidine kinase n=1 Tax=Microbacterium sp. STN6 TaxID=2995588 RepID=UPI002260CB07|nr:histidine kinase [Microbacterium sp. STN6]MCX7522935.1 histidine kinase [Microbacterium sp. STN6]